MQIETFVSGVENFDSLPGTDQILILTWFLHEYRGLSDVSKKDLAAAFESIHTPAPYINTYIPRLLARKPAVLLGQSDSFKLARTIRQQFSARFPIERTSGTISKVLENCRILLPTESQKEFLDETLRCYINQAFRASIIMGWMLGYDHIRHWIFSDSKRTASFNAALKIRYPKKSDIISTASDLDEFKEFEVIEILRTSKLISKSIADILREKLNRRNAAAHPSSTVFSQHQADDAISDLIVNVISKMHV